MTRWTAIHLAVGVAGVIAFVLTGQYMHWVHDHLRGMPEAQRLYFRSTHIYLMWSALLNLLAAGGAAVPARVVLRAVQHLASAAIVAGPFLLCVSFFFEPYNTELVRPAARWAIYLALAGVLARVAAQQVERYLTRPSRQDRDVETKGVDRG